MKQKYYLILGFIAVIGIIFVSGCTPSDENFPDKSNSVQSSSSMESTDPPRSKESCEGEGGKWYESYGETREVCILPYSDGGKKCNSSEECEGKCVTNIGSQMGKEGICQKDTDTHGCFNPVENERFTCLLDDIMIQCDSNRWDSMCDNLNGDLFFE